MIKAVIFDMDGLLVDSEPYWDKARFIMAAEAGVEWNKNDHKAVMGVSTAEWVDYMIERLGLTMAPEVVENHIVDQMVQLYKEQIPFLPGAVETVALSASKYPLGLASGSPKKLIEIVTGDERLQNKFQVIVSADEVAHGKPSPDVYLETAKRMSVDAEGCVCLEDSGNGILAGKNAGMRVIAVPDDRFPPDAEKLRVADVVLQSLTDFSLVTIETLG